MKYRPFGKTGFNVSALGFGAMRLPAIMFIPQTVHVKKSVALIRSAIDKGINYIDTALPYGFGASEKTVGLALRDGYRERVHLTTKLFMPFVKKAEDFDRMLANQLNKLQTDYIDTYLFHALGHGSFQKIKDLRLIDKMKKARDEGKIHHIGFSFHDTWPVFKEIVDYYDWDVTQIQYNYMDTAVQATEAGLKYAADKEMAVVIMEPVKGGMLANPPAEAREVMRKASVKRSSVDWALQYLWNLPEVSTVLSGMSSQKMLDDNCRSAENSGVGTFNADDQKIISELVGIYHKSILVPCTACQYCMNCNFGVNIPRNFAILNNMSTERTPWMRWMIRATYKRLAKKPEQLNKEKNNGNASLCTECGACLPKCPQGIHIAEELKNVDLILGKRRNVGKVYPGK